MSVRRTQVPRPEPKTDQYQYLLLVYQALLELQRENDELQARVEALEP